MNVGDTFLMEHPRGRRKHLFFVVFKTETDRLLLVHVSSIKLGRDCDTSCVVRRGEHPFIKHDSFVVYSAAMFAIESHVEAQIRAGICRPQASASPALLKRISDGAHVSAALPGKYASYFP